MRLRMLTGIRSVDVVESDRQWWVAGREGMRARVRCCQRREWRESWVVIQGIGGSGFDSWRREFRPAFRVFRVVSEKRKMWLVTSDDEGAGATDGGVRPKARRAALYSKWVPMD